MVIYIIPGMIYLAIFRSLLIWNWAIIMRNITANLPTLGGETRAFGGKRLQKVGNSLFSGGNPCRFPSSGLAVAVGVHVARAMMFLSVSTGKILWQCSNSCRGASTSWHVKEIMAVTNQLWVRWQKMTCWMSSESFRVDAPTQRKCRFLNSSDVVIQPPRTPGIQRWLSTQSKRETNMTKVPSGKLT